MSNFASSSDVPYASEPIQPSELTLDRRDSKLKRLSALRQRCSKTVEGLTIDHEIEQIRTTFHTKALDEDFSVALRERWQTWSRNANPFRTELASSAASELDKAAAMSDSEVEAMSGESGTEEQTELGEAGSSRPKKRRRAFRAKDIKVKVGTTELDVTEGWEHIRQQREGSLVHLDAALPNAFRFSERQLKVYAHRLKPKFTNTLDRPFEVSDLHRLLHSATNSAVHSDDHSSEAGPSTARTSSPQPTVWAISFFNSSLDLGRQDAAAQSKQGNSGIANDLDGDNTRDDYVKRICGDGLGGMKRSQTVELLSSHTLSDLQTSLFCWSDEQPERLGWRQRLKRQLSPLSASSLETARRQGEVEEQAGGDEEENLNRLEYQDVRFARFTGERRHTDSVLIIEDKLYGKGVRHGDAAHEADYATLLESWKRSSSSPDSNVGWKSNGGDLSLRLDQLDSVRVGQPYWLLHQGDCAHCFVIEQIRALRPSEELALYNSEQLVTNSVETAPKGTAIVRFPRVTWLSTPAMLRFSADHKDNYGLGHRILHWESISPFPLAVPGSAANPSRPTNAESAQQAAWQIAMGRTKRKDEGLLRKKQGKCLACTLRKAQVGILGGDRVRLPPIPTDDVAAEEVEEGEAAVNGLDDHLVSLCTSCAALLGLPTRSIATEAQSEACVQLDWQRINSEKGASAGWTVFPLY